MRFWNQIHPSANISHVNLFISLGGEHENEKRTWVLLQKRKEKLRFMTGNSPISLHRARLCKFIYACFLNLQVPLLCGSIHFCLIICFIEFIFFYCEFKYKKINLTACFLQFNVVNCGLKDFTSSQEILV